VLWPGATSLLAARVKATSWQWEVANLGSAPNYIQRRQLLEVQLTQPVATLYAEPC
jgi:hypothetical protein